MLPDTDESGLNERSTHDLRPLRVQPNAPSRSSSASSVAMTIVVFMASLALVRYLMPKLVEEVHYSIERGRQRAQFEASGDILSKDPLNQLSSSSQLVAQRIAPSVVHIDTRRETLSGAEQTQQSKDNREIRGQGSGVIVSSAGHILTNFHVVQGAEEIIVTLSDDREVSAEVIGTDPATDLALLSTNTAGLTPVEWGDSDALQEGAMVWAVGSPFGLSKTITFGILSAKERRSYEGGKVQEFLQSDAAVSAGNSGGPLVDSRGLLVGINTAIIGPTYQGVSFSIPANSARQIYQRMVSNGPRIRGWLGSRS